VPDDGDNLDAASVEVAFQALANRTDLAHQQLSGSIPCTGSKLKTNAGIESAGDITASGWLYCDGSLASNGGFFCNGSAVFDSTVQFNFTVNLGADLVTHTGTFAGHNFQADNVDSGNMSVTGELAGKVRRVLRYNRITADTDQTFTVASYDHVSCGNALTAIRAWNLDTTGLVAGNTCEFYNGSNWNVLLKVGGVTVYTLVSADYREKVRLVWDGSAFLVG
jgi:hypothetical protein